MPTLTSSTSISILNAAPAQESIQLSIIPAPMAGARGTGRLIHPALGTLDYTLPPHEWTNIDSDLIVPPTWSSSKTLSSTSHTLWPGSLRDVEVTETWTPDAGLSMPLSMLRILLAFYVNPPDFGAGEYIEWWPSYTCNLGFKVLLTGIDVNGAPLKMSPFTKGAELVEYPISLRIRPVERINT